MTNYEVGNALISSIGPEITELAEDCKRSHPELSALFEAIAQLSYRLGNELEQAETNESGDALAQQMITEFVEEFNNTDDESEESEDSVGAL